MMTCKETGPLIDREDFEKLLFMKRMGVRFHLMICGLCRGYKKDSAHINEVVKMAKPNEEHKLTQEEKDGIKTALSNDA